MAFTECKKSHGTGTGHRHSGTGHHAHHGTGHHGHRTGTHRHRTGHHHHTTTTDAPAIQDPVQTQQQAE